MLPSEEEEEEMGETLDLFAKLGKKKNESGSLGVNPPMPEDTPEAPPIDSVEEKVAKRGRPKGSKNKPKFVEAEPEVEVETEPAKTEPAKTAVEANLEGDLGKLEMLELVAKKMHELNVKTWIGSPVGDVFLG